MLNTISIDNISYNNISSVEQNRFYSYIHLLHKVHPFKLEYLLNTTHIETHSIIERFIYDIACTQMHTKLNKQFNHNDNYITFSFVKNSCSPTIHFQHVENGIMTSIVNLSDNPTTPFLFVKLTIDDYEEKKTQKIRECQLSIPKQGNIVTFDPNIYIYENIIMFSNNNNIEDKVNCDERQNYSLVIQILNKKPRNTPVFNYDINSAIVSQLFDVSKYELPTNNCENIERLSFRIESKTEEVTMNILLQEAKYDFLNILYNVFEFNIKSAFNILSPLLEEHIEKHLLFKLKLDEDKLPEQNNIVDNSVIHDKFYQRFTHREVFTPTICDWIINEAEQYAFKNGWITDRHLEYPTTDIELFNIQPVFSFMMIFMQTIEQIICKSYCVEIETIDIRELFIAKYTEKQQNMLDMHTDGQESNMSISILLNDEFEGGDLIYVDHIKSYAEKGDMVIHTNHHVHGVTPVTKGTRYSLILFLKIKFID